MFNHRFTTKTSAINVHYYAGNKPTFTIDANDFDKLESNKSYWFFSSKTDNNHYKLCFEREQSDFDHILVNVKVNKSVKVKQ